MPDQADGLRSLFAQRPPTIAIVAGADPAKATVALGLASRAADGDAALLVDATPGRVAIACATACRYELAHVAAGDVALVDVVRRVSPTVLLLPAARAIARHGVLGGDERARIAVALSQDLAAIAPRIGTIVVHAADGEAARAATAFGGAARAVVVASADRASLHAAYFEIKALAALGVERFEIVVRGAEGARVLANLSAAARRFLAVRIVDGGSIDDPCSVRADRNPVPFEEEACHAAIA